MLQLIVVDLNIEVESPNGRQNGWSRVRSQRNEYQVPKNTRVENLPKR